MGLWGYGICLFWRPGFVILKQNRGDIRDRKYERDAENNPRENGIERNFESRWRYLTLFWTLIIQFLMWPCINMHVVKLAVHLRSVFYNKVAYTLVLRFVISPLIFQLYQTTFFYFEGFGSTWWPGDHNVMGRNHSNVECQVRDMSLDSQRTHRRYLFFLVLFFHLFSFHQFFLGACQLLIMFVQKLT